jgi:hypothetical protein
MGLTKINLLIHRAIIQSYCEFCVLYHYIEKMVLVVFWLHLNQILIIIFLSMWKPSQNTSSVFFAY